MSEDEEYARSLLILDWNAGRHPAARRLLEGEVKRSIENNPHIADLMLKNAHRRLMETDSGLQIPNVLVTEMSGPRVRRVIRKIVMGLYYNQVVQTLAAETQVAGLRRLGDGVFSYAVRKTDDELAATVWVASLL